MHCTENALSLTQAPMPFTNNSDAYKWVKYYRVGHKPSNKQTNEQILLIRYWRKYSWQTLVPFLLIYGFLCNLIKNKQQVGRGIFIIVVLRISRVSKCIIKPAHWFHLIYSTIIWVLEFSLSTKSNIECFKHRYYNKNQLYDSWEES